jgi:hypothetical protein
MPPRSRGRGAPTYSHLIANRIPRQNAINAARASLAEQRLLRQIEAPWDEEQIIRLIRAGYDPRKVRRGRRRRRRVQINMWKRPRDLVIRVLRAYFGENYL